MHRRLPYYIKTLIFACMRTWILEKKEGTHTKETMLL